MIEHPKPKPKEALSLHLRSSKPLSQVTHLFYPQLQLKHHWLKGNPLNFFKASIAYLLNWYSASKYTDCLTNSTQTRLGERPGRVHASFNSPSMVVALELRGFDPSTARYTEIVQDEFIRFNFFHRLVSIAYNITSGRTCHVAT